MEIQIAATRDGEADEAELRALREWLLQESPRPGRVELVAQPAAPGTMGPVSDTLQVALGAGGALTVLAGSVGTWIGTRRQHVAVRLRRADGAEIEVDASVKDPEATIERFLRVAAAEL
jgi:Effector Associated Constant Component 1